MSIQTSNLRTELVPLSKIRRPIPPVLDYQKIDAMVSTLKGQPMASATCKVEDIEIGKLPPVDVFKVKEQGKEYYFAFGGCHRFQAYDRIGAESNEEPLVESRILPATRQTLKLYLGASVDEMFKDIDAEKQ